MVDWLLRFCGRKTISKSQVLSFVRRQACAVLQTLQGHRSAVWLGRRDLGWGHGMVFAYVSFKDHLPGPYMFNYRMRFFNDLRMVEKLVLYPFKGNFRIFTWVNG